MSGKGRQRRFSTFWHHFRFGAISRRILRRLTLFNLAEFDHWQSSDEQAILSKEFLEN